MIYKNKIIIKPVKNLTLSFDKFFQTFRVGKDENLLTSKDSSFYYNFKIQDGSLKTGFGIKDLTFKNTQNNDYVLKTGDSIVNGIWTTRWLSNANQEPVDYVFYILNDGKMHYANLEYPEFGFTMTTTFNEVPEMTKIRQNLLEAFVFTSPTDSLVLLNQSSETTYANVPKVMDACYHYNKLFAITAQTRNALIYSSETEVTNWTNSNTYRIDFTDDRGRLLKIMSFHDNLYVFREFGITKVSPYSVESDFSIEHLYQSPSYIYPQTITICGENVIFLTRDGLYSFNGSAVKKLKYEVIDKIENNQSSSPCAGSYKGKYFLACKMTFDDKTIGCESATYVNNCILCFDFSENGVEVIRGVDVKKFAELNSKNFNKLCLIFRGSQKNKIGEITESGAVFGSQLTACWKSAFCDLDHTEKLKHVKEIKLISKGDCSFKIESDIETKTYQITGSNKVQRLKTDVKGKMFSFSFESTASQQKISKPEILVTVYSWK